MPTKKLILVMVHVPRKGVVDPIISKTEVPDRSYAHDVVGREVPDLWYLAEVSQ